MLNVAWLLVFVTILIASLRWAIFALHNKKRISWMTLLQIFGQSGELIAGIYALLFSLFIVYSNMQGIERIIPASDAALVTALLLGGANIVFHRSKQIIRSHSNAKPKKRKK